MTLYKMQPELEKNPRWVRMAWGEPADRGLWQLMGWMLHESWQGPNDWLTCQMVA